MFNHVFEHINANGILGTLYIGIIPSVLLVAALILVLKLIEMNRDDYDGVYKSITKQANRERQAAANRKLQKKLQEEQDSIAAEGKVNHLRIKMAKFKEASDKLNKE